MTFVLKELSALRSHFDDTVQIILKREKKGKVEDLSNPRKYELQHLSAILSKLEEQVRQKSVKPHSTANQATVFYGAMLSVMKDIEDNRGMMESSGLLSSRLADAIGISDEVKAENRPDLYQTAKFYTALNAFLNQIFVDNDSRKGFAKDHMLLAVPTDNLHQLIKISYKLEKNAQKAIIATFVADGKTTANLNEYKEPKKSPASATDRFKGWDQLNADLDDLIKDELADKNVSKIDRLSQHRAAQLHFLNTIRETLKTSTIDEAERTAILAGSMHLVRQQIIGEYKGSLLSNLEKSVIYKGLNKILGADEVSSQDTEALITSATHFVRFMTVEPKTSGKKTIRTNNIFSSIAGFDLKTTFNLLIEMIHDCRTAALKHVVEEFKKEGRPHEKPSAGYLGGLSSALGSISIFRGKKADASDEEEEEDELEHKSNHSATT